MKIHADLFLPVSCVTKSKVMLPLNNNQISLLTLFWPLYTGPLHNDHLSVTITETLSPKWLLYTGLTVYFRAMFLIDP